MRLPYWKWFTLPPRKRNRSNDLVKKWAEAANEAVKPDEKEPKPIAEKVEMPDIETQLEIAKITAERDVYKRLYEDAMARR